MIFAQDRIKIFHKTDQRIEYDTDAKISYQMNYSKAIFDCKYQMNKVRFGDLIENSEQSTLPMYKNGRICVDVNSMQYPIRPKLSIQ